MSRHLIHCLVGPVSTQQLLQAPTTLTDSSVCGFSYGITLKFLFYPVMSLYLNVSRAGMAGIVKTSSQLLSVTVMCNNFQIGFSQDERVQARAVREGRHRHPARRRREQRRLHFRVKKKPGRRRTEVAFALLTQ